VEALTRDVDAETMVGYARQYDAVTNTHNNVALTPLLENVAEMYETNDGRLVGSVVAATSNL